MSGDQGPPDDVGSVAEEAAKLLGALTGWAKDTAQDVNHAAGEHLATGAPECTYCPICRTVHAVRQLSPEVRDQLGTAATALLQAASGLIAAATQDTAARPGVEHIDLDDDTGDTGNAGGAAGSEEDDEDWTTGDWPDAPEDTDPEEGDR